MSIKQLLFQNGRPAQPDLIEIITTPKNVRILVNNDLLQFPKHLKIGHTSVMDGVLEGQYDDDECQVKIKADIQVTNAKKFVYFMAKQVKSALIKAKLPATYSVLLRTRYGNHYISSDDGGLYHFAEH